MGRQKAQMGTVKVTCGHVELGKKVVCEGCYNAVVSTLGTERDAWRKLETEIVAERNRFKEELEDVCVEKMEWMTLADGLEKSVRAVIGMPYLAGYTKITALKEALVAYDTAAKSTMPAPTHGETQKEPK